jgi:hypothetical protein
MVATRVRAPGFVLVWVIGLSACTRSASPAAAEVALPDVVAVEAAAPDENPMSKRIGEDFAKKFSCPLDRVVVKVRDDIDPVRALVPGLDASMGTPPDDVKADPGRYEKWKADQQERLDDERRTYARNTMFEVGGCDHAQILGCHPHVKRPGLVSTISPDCTEVAPRPSASGSSADGGGGRR